MMFCKHIEKSQISLHTFKHYKLLSHGIGLNTHNNIRTTKLMLRERSILDTNNLNIFLENNTIYKQYWYDALHYQFHQSNGYDVPQKYKNITELLQLYKAHGTNDAIRLFSRLYAECNENLVYVSTSKKEYLEKSVLIEMNTIIDNDPSSECDSISYIS